MFNISDVKFMPASKTIFLGSSNSQKHNLGCFYQVTYFGTQLFLSRKLDVVICNKHKCFLTKNISAPTTSQGLHGISQGIVFMWLCLLIFQACGHTASWYFQCLHSYLPNTVTLLQKVLSFQCPHGCCSTARASVSVIKNGDIILLPLVAVASVIANSCLIGHLCFMHCSTSSFLCCESCIMYDFSLWRSCVLLGWNLHIFY